MNLKLLAYQFLKIHSFELKISFSARFHSCLIVSDESDMTELSLFLSFKKNQMKVLFIASNIPTPKQKNNRIILTIAEKLSHACKITIVFPAAFVFPPFSYMKKYRSLKGIKTWTDGRFTINPVRYPRLPGKTLSYLLIGSIKPEKYVDRGSLPDLCHAHYIMPDGYIACKLKEKYGIPYIVSVRGGDIRHMQQLNGKGSVFKKFVTVLQHASVIVVHNRPQQEFVSQLGFNSTLMPHGIESNLLTDAHKKETPISIIVVAELIKQKNVAWVIRAVKEYRGVQDIELKIAGTGIYEHELKLLSGNMPHIQFLGHIPHHEVMQLLETGHIFAVPSVNETFGLVYLEAAAKRNAVIGHKNEGIDGSFEDGQEMLFCTSYEDFKTKLFELIDNPLKRKQIADAAYHRVQAYIWENILERYLKLYNFASSQIPDKE